ncbi:putative transporter [Wickerhamomyces ciferrii]|uniref:Transporter n=1 Tax=Wickerhamomyces ciferrii (strain ATCC 14091 / BCRC 22168 / CBS 111 / JCM 3599 / NBRC 0793 / NRRL Y-1031 F-60-10) TaxID=1206466 RepID=K0KP72_WICCF|nr:putative transporter [Wickerhamomyces ciferrii]CCH43992.1 putative transporter [Wickerhamomyces ciferrii]
MSTDNKDIEISHIETNVDDQLDKKSIEKPPSINEELRHNLEIPDEIKHLSEDELKILEKKTRRKIDIRILPMLVYIYILNYLDRNNIASARLGGLEEDLGLKGNQYQTCISILFVGYILMQIPSNMIVNKIGRPSLFITVIMTIWAIISTCTGAVQNYPGLVVARLLLGFVEAGFFGSALYYLSCWYSRTELSLRNAVLYSGSLFSGALSGLIASGIIDRMDGVKGLRSWRWLFIIEGAITCASVPLAYLILPDMPHNSKFLNEQERAFILWKLRKEVGQDDSDQENKESYASTMLLTFKDIKVWAITGILSFLVAAAGVTNFFPSVVQTLNFDRVTTLGLTVPPYMLAVIATFIWARHADKTGERFWHVVFPLFLALISFIIAVATTNTGARYFAMCLMIPSIYCSFTTILSWMSNCVPRPPLKRAIAISTMNCLSNSTSIWNSYLYPSSAEPRYLVAFVCNCVFVVCSMCIALVLRTRLMILNKKIETGTMEWEKELGKGNDGSKISPEFRYLY